MEGFKMIIKELDFYDFKREFEEYDRVEKFSLAGLSALYDLITEYAEDSGEPFKLDVIGLCCDFTEYDTIEEALEDYGMEDLEELERNTTIKELRNNGLLVLNF